MRGRLTLLANVRIGLALSVILSAPNLTHAEPPSAAQQRALTNQQYQSACVAGEPGCHGGNQGNYNDAVGDSFGTLALGLLAVYAISNIRANATDQVPVSHKVARNSRAAKLADVTLFLPNLSSSIWFDDSGHAVTVDPTTEEPLIFDWRVMGDTVCLFEPYTESGDCLRLGFDAESGLLNGVYLANGTLQSNLQAIALDIDNHGAKISALLPPEPEPISHSAAPATTLTAANDTGHSDSEKLTKLVDQVVGFDAGNWAVYRYVEGSVKNARYLDNPEHGTKILYGDFVYQGLLGPAPGWAKIQIRGDQVECVLFWDENGCRPAGAPPSSSVGSGGTAPPVDRIFVQSDGTIDYIPEHILRRSDEAHEIAPDKPACKAIWDLATRVVKDERYALSDPEALAPSHGRTLDATVFSSPSASAEALYGTPLEKSDTYLCGYIGVREINTIREDGGEPGQQTFKAALLAAHISVFLTETERRTAYSDATFILGGLYAMVGDSDKGRLWFSRSF